MSYRTKRQSGQALIMLTLALFALCGIMGLAVDLGWSFYVKKKAQSAADAAALAAVAAAQKLGLSPPFACGNATGKIYCSTTAKSCGDTAIAGNLNSACVYAALNGFTQGGRVNVLVQADITTPAPTVPNVVVSYWVTVRVNQQVPQLFSAVLGNATGLVSARATAALTNVIFNASLDLLNREHDPNPVLGRGVDLTITGGGSVTAPGGMIVASALNGSVSGSGAANLNSASSQVKGTPFSDFRGALGSCRGNGNSNCNVGPASNDWTLPPTYNVPDGVAFGDPTTQGKAKTQPPLDPTVTQACPVPGGNLKPSNVPVACRANGGTALGPGIYYASVSTNNTAPSGSVLNFADNSTTFSGGSFGQFIFLGGLTTSPGNQTITFGPGRYVLAGTTSSGTPEFKVDNGTTIKDANTGSTQIDAGELFIFTNGSYSWNAGSLPDGTTWSGGNLASMLPNGITPTNFTYSEGGFKTGNDKNTSITLSGLNPLGTNVPTGSSNLTAYEDFLFWQDRGNSYVRYDNNGVILTPQNSVCGIAGQVDPSATLVTDINNPCAQTVADPNAPQFDLLATPKVNLHGYLYQPRGAWLNMQGGGSMSGPLKIITGALKLGGTPDVTLIGTSTPITITETALIE